VLNQIGRWTGSAWQGFGLGIPATVVALAGSNHDLYAAGKFTTAGWTNATSIGHFNGKTWTRMGADVTGTPGACARTGVVGGNFSATDGVKASNVALWNGSSWHGMGTGIDGRSTRCWSTTASCGPAASFTTLTAIAPATWAAAGRS
jgi:hypothetical protein